MIQYARQQWCWRCCDSESSGRKEGREQWQWQRGWWDSGHLGSSTCLLSFSCTSRTCGPLIATIPNLYSKSKEIIHLPQWRNLGLLRSRTSWGQKGRCARLRSTDVQCADTTQLPSSDRKGTLSLTDKGGDEGLQRTSDRNKQRRSVDIINKYWHPSF